MNTTWRKKMKCPNCGSKNVKIEESGFSCFDCFNVWNQGEEGAARVALLFIKGHQPSDSRSRREMNRKIELDTIKTKADLAAKEAEKLKARRAARVFCPNGCGEMDPCLRTCSNCGAPLP